MMTEFDFTVFPELGTERLHLRRIKQADTEAWLAVFNHPEVMRYLTDFGHSTTNLNEVESIIKWTDDIFTQQTGIRWAITLKPDSRMIGSCGFHLYKRRDRCAEIGYELQHDYWRQGIMSEALSAVLEFGFKQMQLHRAEANVTEGNQPSGGLLRRLGFKLEGTWRDKVFARGQFHNLWQFGLLENEYRIRNHTNTLG
jgi:RimJ/RimL family protein N-acetyltransferase